MKGFLITVCLIGAAAASDVSKERPVTKVIGMLKDMAAQLSKEADLDEEAFVEMFSLMW